MIQAQMARGRLLKGFRGKEGSIEIQLEAYQTVTETLYINKKPLFGLGTFNFIIILAAACAAIAGIVIWRIKVRK